MVECCGAPQPGLWFAVSVPGPFWMSIFSMQDIPHVLDSHAGGLLSLLENKQFPIEYQEPARLEPEPPQHRFSAGAGRMRRTGSLLLSDMCSRFWPDEPRTLLKLRVSSSILGF